MKPTADVLIPIFDLFLADFGVDNFRQPDLTATQSIKNLERYDDAIMKCNLWKCIAIIVQACGVPDFTISDVLNPKRRKTQTVLSTLINAWYTFSEMREKWVTIEDKNKSHDEQKEAIRMKIKHLKRLCEEKASYLSQNRNKNQHLEQELNKLVDAYEGKQKVGLELAEENRALKQQCAQMKALISDTTVSAGEKKEEISSLEQKIVRSPDKIAAETQAKEKELENIRLDKRRHEKEYMEFVKNIDAARETIKEMQPAMESLVTTFDDVEKLRGICDSADELKKSYEVKLKALEMARRKLVGGEDAHMKAKEKLSKAQFKYQNHSKTLRELNEGVKKEIDEKRYATASNKQEEKLISEERQLVTKMDQLKLSRAQFQKNLEDKLARHKKMVASYKSVLEQARK